MGNIAIYATKGFEYLLILGFLAVFTTFYLYFTSTRFEPVRAGIRRGFNSMVEWFQIPDDVHFHQGHTWMQRDRDDPRAVRVGLDDFAQKMVGNINLVSTAKVGEQIKQGEQAWNLWIGNKSVSMLAPVSGEIVEVNKACQTNGAILNDDPFGAGWIYKIIPENITKESKNLLSGSLAKKWMETVVDKLRVQMSPEMDVVYQDGGVPMPGMARNIDKDNWESLVADFFLTRNQ
ncbi:MAG: hypothetical protein A2521_05630 [Deltaproteobacteria bacterium RIFOXYD12_FULL_57_12]|nr:MAG: hypothetical protein A2521_05630 [Deltaproteobacteria bacterium RIFOXYD12_FULL_57_12]